MELAGLGSLRDYAAAAFVSNERNISYAKRAERNSQHLGDHISHRFHSRVSELCTRRSGRKLSNFTSMSLDILRASPFVSATATGT